MLCISLICVAWQWAKLASHANGDVGPAANVVTYKYLDYMATCPLLVSKTGHPHSITASHDVSCIASDIFAITKCFSASLAGCSDSMPENCRSVRACMCVRV